MLFAISHGEVLFIEQANRIQHLAANGQAEAVHLLDNWILKARTKSATKFMNGLNALQIVADQIVGWTPGFIFRN